MHVLRRPVLALVLDLLLVVVFATIGRATHADGLSLTGVLATAWPFLTGTLMGWTVVRLLRKDWPLEVGPGITVWVATVVFGMALRQLSGEGTAGAFIVVATLVLGVFLVGWRALATWHSRRSALTS